MCYLLPPFSITFTPHIHLSVRWIWRTRKGSSVHWPSRSLHHICSEERSNPISEVSPELLPIQEIHRWLWPRDLLRTGKAEWRHVIHYEEVKKEVSGWKRRGNGGRYGRRRTGGRGFGRSQTLWNRITKGKSGDAGGGEKIWANLLSTLKRVHQFNLRSGWDGQNSSLATIFGVKLWEEM